MQEWGLTVLGKQTSEVRVYVTDPDGRMLTQVVTRTLDTQSDFHDLLLTSYEQWRAEQSAKAAH